MATDLPGILIVDDNEDNRYTLQLMLEPDGHEQIGQRGRWKRGDRADREGKVQSRPSDLMMPDLNGDEVLKVSRAIRTREIFRSS